MKLGLVGAVGVMAGAGSTALIARLGRGARPRYRCFSDADAELVNAICGTIIPRDDLPGAAETGAVDYIDRQLGGAFARQRETYRRGLAAFRETCRRDGSGFLERDAAGRVAILQAVEAGRVPPDVWRGPSAREFFELVLAHTMQGFYGSPRHGGNRDYASYRMLALDYPPVVGRNVIEGKG
ncbi:MAG TPA: gluconate 2-dehydrogenase subunit 3 family protein [Opitutus sp.]|nr:gluconate 2-dehydrogenase subunit 3 family protein [Opitutus sp.]